MGKTVDSLSAFSAASRFAQDWRCNSLPTCDLLSDCCVCSYVWSPSTGLQSMNMKLLAAVLVIVRWTRHQTPRKESSSLERKDLRVISSMAKTDGGMQSAVQEKEPDGRFCAKHGKTRLLVITYVFFPGNQPPWAQGLLRSISDDSFCSSCILPSSDKLCNRGKLHGRDKGKIMHWVATKRRSAMRLQTTRGPRYSADSTGKIPSTVVSKTGSLMGDR